MAENRSIDLLCHFLYDIAIFQKGSKPMQFKFRFSILALTVAVCSNVSFAGDDIFEIGVGIFGQKTLDASRVRNGVATGAGAAAGAATIFTDDGLDGPTTLGGEVSVSLNAGIAHLTAQVNPIYVPSGPKGSNPIYEGRLRGNIGYIQLQELMIRKNDVSAADLLSPKVEIAAPGVPGDSILSMIGAGPNVNLPFDLGKVAISLGMAYAQYKYLETTTTASNGDVKTTDELKSGELVGAYLGTHVVVKFWKVENELYAAYFVDSSVVANGKIDCRRCYDQQTGMPTGKIGSADGFGGFNIDNTLFVSAIRLPFGSMGPELRLRFLDMPQGSEFVARLGLKVKAAL